MKRDRGVLVFLGPSLPADEARSLGSFRLLPPARQGDIWRALALRPRAIALIDGLFESQPSVWHREILSALDAGVAVFGGGSLGALRAAELDNFGMVGVGQIYKWVRDGIVIDDSEVALLHADAEHGYRPLTLPLVNVREAAREAQRAKILTQREAAALVETAQGIFYQERVWPSVLGAVSPRWRKSAQLRWQAWARKGLPDLKAADARACIQRALRRSDRPGRGRGELRPSSLVRHRRILDGQSIAPGKSVAVQGADVLARMRARPDAAELERRGLNRMLLAGWARSMGWEATPAEVARARQHWFAELGVRPNDADRFFAASNLDESEARRLCEDLALEARVLSESARVLPDGPSRDDAIASEAQRCGHWAASVRGR